MILDASMAVTWLFEDEHTDAAVAVARRVAAEGAIVPGHWRLEVANALRNAVRRGRCDEAFADRAVQRLGRLAIVTDDQTDANAWGDTRVLSRDEALTPYDAAYLELALRRARPLASNDRDLVAAARRRGIETLG